MNKVMKAVFPVTGLGTRCLPATKASPKEMLPIVDKPLIQYAVEEAVAAGMTDLIFVTGRGKRAIEDHFDKAYELEAELQAHGKNKLLKEVRGLLSDGITCAYIRQAEGLGLGPAAAAARGAARAARSSSPTPSGGCCAMKASSPTSSRGSATTAARSWGICRRRSTSRSSIPSSRSRSAST